MASSVNTPTSSNSANRTLPPRGAFGTNNYILKDEYEKERNRWQKDLEDLRSQLSQFSKENVELAHAKAQLNKKIIDIEKKQTPMVDCNRRLVERNKLLMESCKNLEETLSFVRDEKLTLQDQHARIVKENLNLREQRAFPEKLEELQQYRNKVLEYSKLTTALRQNLLEKDRRHEILVQKLRKIKKALSLRKDRDDDEQSVGSSIALDTIAEDLDEDPTLFTTNADIQPTIYEQLEIANGMLNELRTVLNIDDDKSACLLTKVARLQEDYKALEEKQQILELELANARDTSDLFEFQLVELTSTKTQNSLTDQACETDEFLPESDTVQSNANNEQKLNFGDEFVTLTKEALVKLDRLFALTPEHKVTISNGVTCINGLEHKLSFAQNQLNMAQCEIKRINKMAEDSAIELRQKLSASSETSSQKKKELKATIERMKLEADKQANELNTLQTEAQIAKNQLDHAEKEKENFRQSLEESTKKITEVVDSLQKANQLVEDYKERLKISNQQIEGLEEKIQSLEAEIQEASSLKMTVTKTEHVEQLNEEKRRIEVEISRLCVETLTLCDPIEHSNIQSVQQLAEIRRRLVNYEQLLQSANKHQDELEKRLDVERREVQQLRKYNKQLELQFNDQMAIIVELKKRYLDLNAKTNENSKSHESISWTSSNSSDHAEENHSE
ncbi:JAKMIP-CC3 domain-containing protein [Aphelenchoides bicaudatus]|nr:JAKMIP-CC3 domain-containing protein [Aphelenchoides bicaudatus]